VEAFRRRAVIMAQREFLWLVGWAAWLAFTLLVTWAWPRVIAPIFNRFAPLQDAALRERIDALLAAVISTPRRCT